MKKIILQLFALAFLLLVSNDAFAQKKSTSTSSDYYNYETKLLGVGQDGTKTFTIWVTAKKVDEGVELAKRNAIAACLFKGIAPSGQAEKVPAIVPGGITEANEAFFEDFLMLKDKKGRGGKYLRFISHTGNQKEEKIKKGYRVSLDVQVSYDALREYMVSEGMSKSLNFLF